MIDKTLRILIADEHHSQLLHIEKLLNGLGYFRVAPVRTFDELVQLTSTPNELFNLVIVNKALALPYGVDIAEFCRTQTQIQHALFYENQTTMLELSLECHDQLVHASLADVLDASSLNTLMYIIDPPAQRPRLKLLLQPHGALSM
ncbi:hypothetical protein [Pseudomonas fluorescens]|uniref:Chemotaxis protein CheY n=2 Tax=Pseudomonas fluorescens TaxID=294 RepID=A0ABY1TC84_PSEFL|nr:hypothetical protein [Pseudomonas fluorescens]MCI4604586.1 histidine kinase [Pseudomonas fluorescens]PQB01098.1 hypothetical protein B0A76_09425 [Pseudomonas fluorescens]RFP92945.1 histidine kinase [Pseudomonas fluorescens]SNY09995.1 hypothetical protein SAMN04488487_2983 [Pseudomonas fluorescens]SQF89496.1 response regulator receiver protein [Pseudomonas fluorescens]